ncbi:MAG TPA: hypothetical protein VMB27_22445 [Solirubrobacteraceae bacterium]|nr:hypothetical protein [Solirubrobacteraceae bacterium]
MSSTPQGAWRARRRSRRALAGIGCALAMGVAAAPAQADGWWHHGDRGSRVIPGSLLLSTSEYVPANITPGVTELPPGCGAAADPCTAAIADGTYPYVFNNDTVDGSFGVTSPIYLDELSPWGQVIGQIPVPTRDMVTSFSSKSELALNLSTFGSDVTFMGYKAPVAALDVSNSNTPGVVDPTNPVTGADYRVVADLGRDGFDSFTLTNAYSGNNGRAAILNNATNQVYTAGNAGNGSNPQPDGIIIGAGAQILSRSFAPEWFQSPGNPTPVGSFNITQLPANKKTDKIGKDTNFRGLTISGNVVYYTKGSGSNGINTVYFIDTTGKACPGTGVGVPQPGAQLPTSPIAYDPSLLQTEGVVPYNMCVLAGFPTTLAKSATTGFPFGLWFANPTTLYVADEGDGTATYSSTSNTYTDAAAQTTAGLQKWVFGSPVAGQWNLAYTLQSGLDLGQPYTVPGYPTGTNAVTGLPWSPGTDGLRNITGHVNWDGTATIWGITSTVSGSGDQGADPNKLVAITDRLSATTLPGSEKFQTVKTARSGEVLRGVSFAPGNDSDHR